MMSPQFLGHINYDLKNSKRTGSPFDETYNRHAIP